MTKLVSISEDVYEELNKIRKIEGKSFSQIIKELLRYRFLSIKELAKLIEQIGPTQVEETGKEEWESIPRRAEEAWKSAQTPAQQQTS